VSERVASSRRVCTEASGPPVARRSSALPSAQDPLTNVVDIYIRQLRRKLDQDGSLPLLQTVRGFGYKISCT